MKIFKYSLPTTPGGQSLQIPKGFQIHGPAQLQAGTPVFWALVDPAVPPGQCGVMCVATGQDVTFPASATRIPLGTVQLPNSGLVLHYYILVMP